jgi:phosphoribosyl-AMP cyclohydrolase
MLAFDQQGLVPAVIQDESTGDVLMVAFMNAEALHLTRTTGYIHLFSRSRQTIWRKGEQSGNVQAVRGIYVNCEENSLLLKVVQHGAGACHTGHHTCYYRQWLPDGSYASVEERVFDPAHVYAQPASIAVSEAEQTSLEADMRQLYAAYTYLRDHDLSAESNTSRLLQERSDEYLIARLGDELQELADVQAGTHVHSGRQNDTILEASQVGYWLMLLATTRKTVYDEIMPHKAILQGHTVPDHQTLEQAQECLHLLVSDSHTERIAGLVMGFATIGRACAEAGVSPLEPAKYDMQQMRKKGLV